MPELPLSPTMRHVSRDTWFAGVDGCQAGWVVAFARRQCRKVRVRVVPSFADVMAAPEAPAIIAVDIPIGLPQTGGREADRIARSLVGARRSSVFPVPSRRAIFAELGPFGDQQARYAAYRRACVIARGSSNPPKAISIYAFGIFAKIREVDALLQSDCAIRDKVRETHPELAFWRLNGERELSDSKKSEIGLARRRGLLMEVGFVAAALSGAPPKGASPDDVIDAIACVEIARRIHDGRAWQFPNPPEYDAAGLPMAIWA
jgi:predicted RNase H-like nuclease